MLTQYAVWIFPLNSYTEYYLMINITIHNTNVLHVVHMIYTAHVIY